MRNTFNPSVRLLMGCLLLIAGLLWGVGAYADGPVPPAVPTTCDYATAPANIVLTKGPTATGVTATYLLVDRVSGLIVSVNATTPTFSNVPAGIYYAVAAQTFTTLVNATVGSLVNEVSDANGCVVWSATVGIKVCTTTCDTDTTPASLSFTATPAPVGLTTTYVLVDLATNAIAAISNTPGFSGLAVGDYEALAIHTPTATTLAVGGNLYNYLTGSGLTNCGGNGSVVSNTLLFRVCLPLPTIAITSPVNVTAVSTNPPISGTATPGATVSVTSLTGQTCTDTAAPVTGAWTCTSLTFAVGSQTITAIASTTDGVSTVATTSFTVVAPPGLTVAAPPTGPLTQLITGTATPGSPIVITGRGPGSLTLCTTTASASGTFTCSVTLPAGPTTLTVTASGPGGSTSVPITCSAIAPPTVAILLPANNSQVFTSAVISGTATPGSNVTLSSTGGPLCQPTASATGSWSCPVSLSAGPQTLTAITSNLGGISSPATVFLTALALPTVQILSPPTGSTIGLTTVVSGTATPGSVVNVTGNNNSLLCVKVADVVGNFSCLVGLPPGSNTITAVASSIGGTSLPDAVTVTAIVSPTLVVAPLGPLTNLTPTVSGTATPNSLVTITGPTGTVLCSTTASASGTFACPVSVLAGPQTLTVKASNPGGSVSVPVTFTAVAPPMVAITTPANGGTATMSPTVSGTATPNAVVILTGGTGSTGGPVSLTADNTGAYSTTALQFPAGPNSVTAIATNIGGTSSPAVSSFSVVAPPSLTVSAPVNVSTTTTPTVSGTATPGSGIAITNPSGQTICTTTASASGTFACGPITGLPTGLPTGPNTLTVTATGPGGTTTQPITFTTVDPPTVAITTPTDGGTATMSPTVSGTATPNAVVTLTGGTGSTGGSVSLTADNTGAYSTTALQFPAGPNSVTAVATNVGGTSSPAVSSFSVVAPPSLTVSAPVNVSTTTTPTVSGTATPGSVIAMTNPSGQTICTTSTSASGTFACGLTTGLPTGPNTLTVTATGPGGITTQPITFTTVARPTVAITIPVNGAQTDLSPTVRGTATPGSSVTVTGSAGQLCQTTALPSGSWSCTVSISTGPQTLTAMTSNAGGLSAPATINVIGVNLPTVQILSPVTGSTVAVSTVISGTATPGSVVNLQGNGNTQLCAVIANGSGNFSCTVSLVLGKNTITAIASNIGGNSLPDAVTVTAIVSPTLVVAPLGPLTNLTPTVSGTATPNSLVTITGPTGTVLCSTTASASGTFACPVSVLAGPQTLTVKASNPGGSVSVPVTFTAVAPPTIAVNSPANGSQTTLTPVVSGTATPNSSVTVTAPGNLPIVVTTDNAGVWTAPANSLTLTPGPASITATAGNAGGVSSPAITQVTAVAQPTVAINSPANGSQTNLTPVVSGTATPNSSVTVTAPGNLPIMVTTNNTGVWTAPANSITLTPGPASITATAGNAGGISTPAITQVTAVAQPTVAINSPADGNQTTLTPVVSGTATANSSVTATAPGNLPIVVTTNNTGVWTAPANSLTLTPGPASITATAGNAGGISSPAITQVTAVAQPTVAINGPADGSQTTLTPTVSGTATPNSTVVITGPGNVTLCQITASVSGSYACAVSLTAGPQTLTATAGNAGGISSPAITQVTAVAQPTIAINSPANGNQTTLTPVVSGTATANSSVTVNAPGNLPIVVTTDNAGVWTAPANSLTLTPGPASITVTAGNAGGVSSPATTQVTAVAQPTVAINGPAGGSQITLTPTVSGTATPNSTVVITGPGNVTLCQITASVSGSYACAVSLTAGPQTLTVTATNVGGVSTPATTQIMAVAQPTIAINSPANGNQTTLTPVVSGTATANSSVTVNAPGNLPIVVTTDNAGVWTAPANSLTLKPGPASITATAGNAGGISSPAITQVTAVAPPTVSVNPMPLQTINTLTVAGTATPGSSVVITGQRNTTLCSTTATATGAYACPVILLGGLQTLTVTATNPGGSATAVTTPFTVLPPPTVQILSPPTGSTVATTAIISGTATPGSTVNLSGNGNVQLCAVVANLVGSFSCAVGFVPGSTTITAVASSIAGISQPDQIAILVVGAPMLIVATTGPNTSTAPIVSGTATPGSQVVITGPGLATLCTTTASALGTFACPVSVSVGPNTLTVTACTTGGCSATTTSFTALAPPTVAILTPANNSTATTSPAVSGTATPNAVVTLTGGPGSTGGPVNVTASPTGAYSTTAITFAAGPASVTAMATNAGGTSTPAIDNFMVVAPPSLTVSGPVNVSTTATPTVSGTATPNSLITVTNPTGQTVCQTTADVNGTFLCGPISGLPTGPNTLTVTATTPAGSISQPITFTTVAPPTVAMLTPADGTTATTTTPVISGTATPNAVVTLAGGPGSTGGPVSVTTSPTGTYSTSAITFLAGPNSVTAVATNIGGSSPAAVSSFTTAGPPSLTVATPPTGSTTQPITGTATPGSSIVITGGPGNTTLCSTTAAANGTFSCSVTLPAGPNTLTITANGPGGTTHVVVGPFTTLPPVGVLVSPKVFLGGSYSAATGLMNDQLRTKGYLPTIQPYSNTAIVGGVFSHTGGGGTETFAPGITATTGANAIVDWVFVELRSPTSASTVVATRAALVQRDGDVVDVDGVSPVSFSVLPGSYYLSVRHRNHLGVMTASPLVTSVTAVTVDFTNPVTTATYGTNAQRVIALPNSTSVATMWPGNTNTFLLTGLHVQTTIYQGSGNDVARVLSQIRNVLGSTAQPSDVLRGYYASDVNMDGDVKYQGPSNDVGIIFFNVTSYHPGNTNRVPTYIVREQLP